MRAAIVIVVAHSPVITIDHEGAKVLSFDDWTPLMMSTASVLWDLPPPPGHTGRATHEYGIDQLARKRCGRMMLDLLSDYAVAALEHRPDEAEVLRLGETLLMLDREVAELRRTRRSKPGMVLPRTKTNRPRA